MNRKEIEQKLIALKVAYLNGEVPGAEYIHKEVKLHQELKKIEKAERKGGAAMKKLNLICNCCKKILKEDMQEGEEAEKIGDAHLTECPGYYENYAKFWRTYDLVRA